MIRSRDGVIFGKLSDKSWTSSRGYCDYYKAFLLSFKSPSSEVRLPKMSINQDTCHNAMLEYSSYGTASRWFSGSDFYIYTGANNTSKSSSDLGNNYQIPPIQTDTFLVGSKQFKVSDIEVFQII